MEEEGEIKPQPKQRRKTTEAFKLCQEGLKMKKENFERQLKLREPELEARRVAQQSQVQLV